MHKQYFRWLSLHFITLNKSHLLSILYINCLDSAFSNDDVLLKYSNYLKLIQINYKQTLYKTKIVRHDVEHHKLMFTKLIFGNSMYTVAVGTTRNLKEITN